MAIIESLSLSADSASPRGFYRTIFCIQSNRLASNKNSNPTTTLLKTMNRISSSNPLPLAMFATVFIVLLGASTVTASPLTSSNLNAHKDTYDNLSPSMVKLLASANYLPEGQETGGQKETEMIMNPGEAIAGYTGNDEGGSETPLMLGEVSPDEVLEYDLDQLANNKRATWNSFQGSWGKRASGNWNKLSAAWGKRRPPSVSSWNNLSGMWGKRAKWNELSGMWGKRAWNDMSGGWGKKKRSSPPHWNKLRGMWGKRSDSWPTHFSSNRSSYSPSLEVDRSQPTLIRFAQQKALAAAEEQRQNQLRTLPAMQHQQFQSSLEE